MSTPAHTPLKVLPVFIENSPIKYGVLTGKWGQPALAICDQEENAKAIAFACNSHAALVAALEESNAALMDMHKHARGMWNELLYAGFADKGLKMPCLNRNLAAIRQALATLAAAKE
jgi:hypothetical protein